MGFGRTKCHKLWFGLDEMYPGAVEGEYDIDLPSDILDGGIENCEKSGLFLGEGGQKVCFTVSVCCCVDFCPLFDETQSAYLNGALMPCPHTLGVLDILSHVQSLQMS